MKRKLLFITPSMSSFNRQDAEMLSKHFEVEVWCDPWRKKTMVPLLLIIQFWKLLFILSFKDLVLCSFASYWSMLPSIFGKLFGKPVYIILHGTDACKFDEISYGNLRKPVLRSFIRISVQNATKLFPVSASLIETRNGYFNKDKALSLGLKAEFPNLRTPYLQIPNGFNLDFWKHKNSVQRKPGTFITVASESQHIRKGVDLITKAASLLPTFEFIIVGSDHSPVIKEIPQNVHLIGSIKQTELKALYYQTQFYLQISVFEGFGCALAEAMLCGCVPIGANVNAIPEIVGESGFILKNHNVEDLVTLLKIAGESPDLIGFSEKAQRRINGNYPLSIREQLLVNEMNHD